MQAVLPPRDGGHGAPQGATGPRGVGRPAPVTYLATDLFFLRSAPTHMHTYTFVTYLATDILLLWSPSTHMHTYTFVTYSATDIFLLRFASEASSIIKFKGAGPQY